MLTEWQLQVVPFRGNQIPDAIRAEIKHANQAFHWTPEQTEADFANEQAEYYILLDGEVCLGYVGLHRVLDEATLNMVYIDPELRGQGLGRYLMQFVLDQLAARQVQHLFLEVREQNLVAQKLYQAVGFETLIIRPNYYQQPQDNAVIMQKKLK